jgi:phosphoribosylanthranilate isomerase
MVKVKICGFTVRRDIEDALSLGIDIIGINFYGKSPRYVPVERAERLLENLPCGLMSIGVFVNPDEKTLFESMAALNLSGVQLHGDEPPELVGKIKKGFPGTIVIKALSPKNEKDLLSGIEKYKPDFFLMDAYDGKIRGGTGKRINSELLKKSGLPWSKIFLAGGITPENVKDVLKGFSPYGIDVASGVESSPGRKDREKIRKLLENIHG